MIRLAPLITADVDTSALPGGKASDAAQDFLALLSGALADATTTDKAAIRLQVATDKPATKGESLVSDILTDAQQPDLLIPANETLPVINDEQSTSTPLTTAQAITLAAGSDKNAVKDEKADDLNEDVTASLSALFAMLPGFDNTPKVTDTPSTVLSTEKPTPFTKLTPAQLTTAQPDDAPGAPAQPLTPLIAEAQSKAEVISTPSPVTAAVSPLITSHQTQPQPTVAAPVLSAPLGSHEWQQSLSQHISLFTRQGQQSAELRLHPQDLGEVQISLKVDDNQAQIQMVSPHQHVRAALEAALPALRTQLAESGIQLGQSNISGESFNGQQQAASQQQQNPRTANHEHLAVEDDDVLPVPASLQGRATGNSGVDIFA
ncbi:MULTISPECIES: flagellar hook-length control protein FliK [Escherichia]|uniref:flagellar hook-length control protein FliK n=1 Tax=Escherichia TaxID=561 RepID=UPI000CF789F0|nr:MULTISPECIES: flagellar hook-length control protein FliK [unclassified Escherichia]EFB2829892.1 flagellar hook length control protein FliK [Escherichia coli]EFO2098551.1 flagellar hook length control protein FliK [Escherichia coli]MBB2345229.1 flagellar hook length control protein FliK [Escherichia sp. 93.0743]MBB2349204.1 flagellar hook length control protein FliK [Escherichia sp. 92.1228]MCF7290098.1 flagellar hook length control protein FliK [Escherichia coli]